MGTCDAAGNGQCDVRAVRHMHNTAGYTVHYEVAEKIQKIIQALTEIISRVNTLLIILH